MRWICTILPFPTTPTSNYEQVPSTTMVDDLRKWSLSLPSISRTGVAVSKSPSRENPRFCEQLQKLGAIDLAEPYFPYDTNLDLQGGTVKNRRGRTMTKVIISSPPETPG